MALTQIDDRGLKTPIDLIDNEKIRLGTGNDLELYHDGSNSYIKDTGTGNLYIYSENLRIENADGSESYIEANANGAVELYYNGSKKIETNAGGVDVTGVMQCDQITLLDNEQLQFGTGVDLRIYHNGYNSKIADVGTGALILSGSVVKIENGASDETQAVFTEDGAVELYHNNVKKLDTASGGINVVGYVNLQSSGQIYIEDGGKLNIGTSNDIQIQHDGTDSNITNNTGNLLIYSTNDFYIKHGTEVMFAAKDDGAVELYHDGTKKLATGSGGIIVSGNYYTNDSNRIYLGSDNDLSLYHDGSHGHVLNNTGTQYYASSQHHFYDVGYSELQAKFIGNGAVQLYYDGSHKWETTSTGSYTYGTHSQSGSDIRLKENIVNIENATEKIEQLQGFTYDFNSTGLEMGMNSGKQVGLSAQDVQAVVPEVVSNIPNSEYLTINYEKLVPILIESIKELSTKIETLETKVAALEAA